MSRLKKVKVILVGLLIVVFLIELFASDLVRIFGVTTLGTQISETWSVKYHKRLLKYQFYYENKIYVGNSHEVDPQVVGNKICVKFLPIYPNFNFPCSSYERK